ncbi:MAG: hypothetical protein PSV17_10985 [Methylotenera sp.]|uniref:hypothetical protein n=1 Tax=Methylotenera sp. TaxID=2051956 RepID=UPI0024874DDB|nr:hypothetical protein [Methylotenera sp.]MDI1309938.1 hypothetical protein [Methylotenera sp.]
MLSFTKKLVSALLLAHLSTSVFAAESNTKTLLYISPNDYNYSVHLLAPYYEYWFEQGPLVEPIALKALQEKYGEMALCQANETAETIIRLKPSVFYNPQMHVYHSKLVATVFSGKGDLIGTYVGEAQQLGYTSFDNGTKYHLNKVYGLAMQDLMAKLTFNPSSDSVKSEAKLPCGLIGAQNDTKINFY